MAFSFDSVCIVGLDAEGLRLADGFARAGFSLRLADTRSEPLRNGLARFESSEFAVTIGPHLGDLFVLCVDADLNTQGDVPQADLSRCLSVSRLLAPWLSADCVVLVTGSLTPGATARISGYLQNLRPDLEGRLHVAYIQPGMLFRSSTLTSGAPDDATRDRLEAIFARLGARARCVGLPGAEIAHLVRVARHEIEAAFRHEVEAVCADYGVAIGEVLPDERVDPSPRGRSSSCSSGQTHGAMTLVASDPENLALLQTACFVNEARDDEIFERIATAAAGTTGPIVCLGMRRAAVDPCHVTAPARAIVERLVERFGDRVCALDPDENGTVPTTSLPDLDDAGLVVALVAHEAFFDIPRPSARLLDMCGLWERPGDTTQNKRTTDRTTQ